MTCANPPAGMRFKRDHPRVIKLALIDSSEEDLRRTLAFLSSQRDFRIAGTGRDGYDALRLVQKCKPDLVISELNLDYLKGTEAVPLLRRILPSIKIIILTSREDEGAVLGAIRGDAAGYLLKTADLAVLPRCIRDVHLGARFFSHKIANTAIRILLEQERPFPEARRFPETRRFPEARRSPEARPELPGFPGGRGHQDKARRLIPQGLSKTELQVMRFLADGLSNREIAGRLRLSPGTVRNYISSTAQKMGFQDRTQIALFALQNGLNSP